MTDRLEGFNLARFTVAIYSPVEPIPDSRYPWGESDARVLADLPAIMERVTDQIAEILPEGYAVEILELNGE